MQVPDLWIGDIPPCQANEPCLREIFEKFGGVSLIYFRNKGLGRRSWAYITFVGHSGHAVNAATLQPVVVRNAQGEFVTLKVEIAVKDKAVSGNMATNIWDQMAKVSSSRVMKMKVSVTDYALKLMNSALKMMNSELK